MDPFLHSINHMLMEESIEDATCIQQEGDASYQAILGSFYDIIGEHPPPNSSLVSTQSLFGLHISHQITEEQHVEREREHDGFNILTHQVLNSGVSRIPLPANANLQSSFFQAERADTSVVLPGPARHVACPSSANWNALSTTEVQDYHAAIKFHDRQLVDTKVSCWELKDKVPYGYKDNDRGSNAHCQLPSPYKEVSLKLAGVELSFEDLNLHNHYVALYVGKPGIPTGPPKYGDKEKTLARARKRGDADLRDLILNCGQAVAVGNARVLNELLQDVRQVHGASADGNGSQRAAHYFSEAVVARMQGTGGHYFRAMFHKQPSAVTILKFYKVSFELSPLVQATLYFANQNILKAAEQASRLHIVDYGLEYGMQWAFLINALADQKGGPPLLVITGIDTPQPGDNPVERLEESGRRLAAHARTYNVPFQYHAIASSKWEDLDSSSFHFHEDEALVVNCIGGLRHLTDVESVDSVSPRQKLLMCIHSLKPHLLITGHVNAAYNSSFFLSRFREALYYYSNVFDMLETLWGETSPERLLRERNLYGEILNIVACEGAERVERAETYKQWQVCIQRAGFEQLLIPAVILSRSRAHVKQHYHKDFFVHDEANKWMLLGWRGRTLLALSAWKLSHAQLSWEEG